MPAPPSLDFSTLRELRGPFAAFAWKLLHDIPLPWAKMLASRPGKWSLAGVKSWMRKNNERWWTSVQILQITNGTAWYFNLRSTDSTDLWNAISGVPTCWIDMTCQCVGTPSANRSTRASISSLFLTFIQIHAHQVPYGMFWSLMRNSQLGFIVITSGQWSGKEWHPLELRRVTPGAMTA